ncbi:MAG TPA: hypothetical protein VFT16_04430 [Candidatus Saccharimonadales bacterium]|nr:hypothetical protein [Candidatus Saccharimonadales bacterium]
MTERLTGGLPPEALRALSQTDYDDHFMLGKEAGADRIMGTIELEGRKPSNPADVAAVSGDFLAAASAYADAQMPAGR